MLNIKCSAMNLSSILFEKLRISESNISKTLYIMASLKIENAKAKVLSSTMQVESTKATGWMIKDMVVAMKSITMEIFIKVNTKMERLMEKEFTFGRMESLMMGNG